MSILNKLYCYFIALLLTMLLWGSPLWGQNDSNTSGKLTASVESGAVRVGGTVVLNLRYQLPAGATLPPDPKIGGLEGFTILNRLLEPQNTKLKILVDRLESFETGTLSVAYLDQEGKANELTTDPVSIKVLSNLGEKPEEAQLRPIQGIIPVTPFWLAYLPWGLGLVGLLLAGAAFLWWHRRRTRIQDIEAEIPPHIRAQEEIEELEAQRLFEKGHTKAFYFRFSEILRHYLETLRGFPAAEFTTEEIASCIDNDQDRSLIPLLKHADVVKFADTVPTAARKEEEVKQALSYIRETGEALEVKMSGNGSQGAVQ
ncbi:MAG: hypothetical protein JRF30_04470 [Deltaproteobacteria bacterium]|nr:hypothetical protein [Deltaproteobacteria bacterium]MBW2330180.1 hypothetical protein [Deltaproteobacteria bacterium]